MENGVCRACGHTNAGDVSYIERIWNGSKVVSETKLAPADISTLSVSSSSTGVSPGWYYVDKNISEDDRIILTGDTHLILGDGNMLDVEGVYG